VRQRVDLCVQTCASITAALQLIVLIVTIDSDLKLLWFYSHML